MLIEILIHNDGKQKSGSSNAKIDMTLSEGITFGHFTLDVYEDTDAESVEKIKAAAKKFGEKLANMDWSQVVLRRVDCMGNPLGKPIA